MSEQASAKAIDCLDVRMNMTWFENWLADQEQSIIQSLNECSGLSPETKAERMRCARKVLSAAIPHHMSQTTASAGINNILAD
ncbi:MAG: hypothetical protein QM645_11355 [Asticcacaulis sp.]